MVQPTRIMPILFRLNNKDATHDTVLLGFTMLNILLLTEESTAKSVLQSMGIFTTEDFLLLHDRIVNVRNKEVGMNEKHLVIFYGVLHIIVNMFDLETEVNILKNDEDEEMKEFFLPKSKEYFLKCLTNFINEIKRDYTKNHYIARSIAKINTC